MSRSRFDQLLLAVLAGAVFFFHLGGSHLWDVDEAIFSQAAAEMVERGDYVVPHFNGEMFPDKPALTYWLMAGAYHVFGISELGARFWSAALSIGTVLLTYRLGSRLFSQPVGLWAGLILATNISFDIIARAATPDAALTFCTTAALYFFARGVYRSLPDGGVVFPGMRASQITIEPTWRNFALTYAAMGVGVLAKGPVGAVLPTAVIGSFLLSARGANALAGLPAVAGGPGRWSWATTRSRVGCWLDALVRTASPRHFARAVLGLHPLLAIAMVLAVAAPWYVWVGLRTDWQWPAQFFGVHNFGRFFSAMDNHRGPLFYYFGVVLVLFFPWSIVIYGTFRELVRQIGRDSQRRDGAMLIACWIAVYLGFWSLASTKLPNYIVPMYPALAIATVLLVNRWIYTPESIPRWWPWVAYSILLVVGMGMLVGVPIAAGRLLGGPEGLLHAARLGLVGLVPLVGGLGCLWFTWRQQARQSLRTLGLTAITFSLVLFGVTVGQFDAFQPAPKFIASIAAHRSGQAHVASFRYFRPSMVFYGHQPVAKLPDPTDVAEFFAAHPSDAFLYTVDEHLPALEDQLPADVVVLQRQRRLFLPGQALLLGRAPTQAAASEATLSTAARQ